MNDKTETIKQQRKPPGKRAFFFSRKKGRGGGGGGVIGCSKRSRNRTTTWKGFLKGGEGQSITTQSDSRKPMDGDTVQTELG